MTQFLSWILAGAVVLGTPALARAQYFGQNKVQYDRFAFQVLRTDTFDIYHYPEEAEAVRDAARLVEGWRVRLTDDLGLPLPGRQTLILYASHPHFRQTQAIGGLIDESTGGVTESAKRRMVLPFSGSLGETSHVLGHELVHAFQYSVGTGARGPVAALVHRGDGGISHGWPGRPAHRHVAARPAQSEEIPGFED